MSVKDEAEVAAAREKLLLFVRALGEDAPERFLFAAASPSAEELGWLMEAYVEVRYLLLLVGLMCPEKRDAGCVNY